MHIKSKICLAGLARQTNFGFYLIFIPYKMQIILAEQRELVTESAMAEYD